MRACHPTGDEACPVDVRQLALAIPPIGLAPDAIARADLRPAGARANAATRSWVWQHGTTLIVLDRQASGSWLVSELDFHDGYGYYTERRRATYDSAREATGVALSWVLRLGYGPSLAAAAALDAWCTLAFVEGVAVR